jgi:tRNA A-37 threonylcarbamoyl transferase component Bud32
VAPGVNDPAEAAATNPLPHPGEKNNPYAIPALLRQKNPTVFSLVIEGKRVFVKQSRRGKNPLGKFCQRLLWRLTANPLLLPPLQPLTGSAEQEAATLRRLGEAGINVPALLHAEPDYLVMADAGSQLEEALRQASPSQRHQLMAEAAQELRRLHDQGYAHGGSQIKNMALQEGKIYFFDFEERIDAAQLPAFQLRDLFLLLFSLERAGFDPNLKDILASYGWTGEKSQELLLPLRRLKLVNIFRHPPLSWLKVRDIKAIGILTDKAGKP